MSTPESDGAAIRQIIRALKVAGWWAEAHVEDGGDTFPVKTEQEAINGITAVDMAWLHVQHNDGRTAYVFFVMGNEPFEVANDYTVNLEDAIGPLMQSWW